MDLNTIRSCLFVNDNPYDQVVFINAMANVFPDTLCFMAHDGKEALEIMRDEEVVPDYILMELKMAGMDGMNFLLEVKKINPLKNPIIIVHSPDAEAKQISKLKDMGATAIYFRPYDYQGICNLLRIYFKPENIQAILN